MSEIGITELTDLARKQRALEVMGETVPASINYQDLMLMMTPAEWAAYRIFIAEGDAGEQTAFGGISPEGNFNVYGTDETSVTEMAGRLILESRGRAQPFYRASISGLGAISRYKALSHSLTLLKFVRTLEAAADVFPPPNPEFEFSSATSTEADLSDVKQWYEAYNTETNSNYSVPPVESLGSRGLYLLRRQGRLVACCAHTVLNPRRLWLGRMFVLPEYRRTGVGTELQRQLGALAREAGQTLALHVHSDNLGAIRFYEALGFKETGVGFYAKYAR